MYTIILNVNNINNIILFKYKYNYLIKIYLNNYIKNYKFITYIIKYYLIHNKNITKHTKNRSLINYSNKKIRIQKGLGKARLRNFSSSICKQGYCVFGPFFKNNIVKFNKLTYKLIYIYLIINKRSNIIIIKFEDILNILFIIYNNILRKLEDIIIKILLLKGIINYNKYFILNFYNLKYDIYKENNYINKFIIINLLKYNNLIFIV